jgi:hypothetical protein
MRLIHFTLKFSLILDMNLDPLLLKFSCKHAVFRIMALYFELFYMEVHDIFETASFSLVE